MWLLSWHQTHAWYTDIHTSKISILVRVIIAIIKHHDRSNLRKKGLVFLTVLYSSSLAKAVKLTQDKNLESGADAEAIEGAAYWIIPCGLLWLLSHRTQYHLVVD